MSNPTGMGIFGKPSGTTTFFGPKDGQPQPTFNTGTPNTEEAKPNTSVFGPFGNQPAQTQNRDIIRNRAKR